MTEGITRVANEINGETDLPLQHNFVDGEYVTESTDGVFETRHPGNDKVICEVEVAGRALIDRAVSAADSAFGKWSKMPAAERGAILSRAAAILRERKFADCADDMAFVREEVFGPLMAVLEFETEQEAIRRANDSCYGRSAAVFTNSLQRAHRVAMSLEAGFVWINDYNVTPPEVPFGGYKQSGFGRENGLQAIEHYTQIKTVYTNLGDVPRVY